MHHPATNSLVTLLARLIMMCITERAQRLVGNEIELGMKILTIESRASNIPMTKGITYVVIAV